MKALDLPNSGPLSVDLVNIEWLGFDELPKNLENPFYHPDILDIDDPVEELIRIASKPDYLAFACKLLLNVEVIPFQALILEKLWVTKFPLLIATRGGSKTFTLSLYCLLRLIFHQGCRIVVTGAAFRQSRIVWEYMCQIWDKSPVLRDIAGGGKKAGPTREIDRCEFRIGDSIMYAVPTGDGQKIRGLRANYIIAEEFASISEEIFNVVISGFGATQAEPVAKIKENFLIKKLKTLGQWDERLTNNDDGFDGNQIIRSGTAYFSFNHFEKTWKQWRNIILSKGDKKKLEAVYDGKIPNHFDWRDYCVIRIPYTHVPEGLLDEGIIAQAKASSNNPQFLMEYGAVFVKDTDGFYKRSIIEAATTNKPVLTKNNEIVQFSAIRQGDIKKSYAMGIDPAADRDNAAIVLLENNLHYRKVVYCWTTNKKRYGQLKKYVKETSNVDLSDDYYRYIAKKVRELMRHFNIEHIIMDKNGGGTAIAEALSSKDTCIEDEMPVYQIIDPDDPKPDDIKDGVHILELLAPTQEINSDANHGMLKDIQDKVLLFPMFDSIEIARALELDRLNNLMFDTYEDLVDEIEELKNEMTSIVCVPSSKLGNETFDTPEIKLPGSKKGRLRKDRYSALLYANYYLRNKDKNTPVRIQYDAVGGTKQTTITKGLARNPGALYSGPGMIRFGQQDWNTTGGGWYHKGR